MRKYTVPVLAALVLAVPACGSDDTSTPSTTVAGSTTTTVETSALEQLLLTLADLTDIGNQWRNGPTVGDADFNDANQIPCDKSSLSPTIAGRLRPIIGRQFEPQDGSYRHLMTTITIGDAAQLAVDLGQLIDTIRGCPAESTFDGAPVSIERIDLPDLGDQRAAFRIEASESATNFWVVRTAVVRVENRYLAVSLTEILDSPAATPTVSDEEFVALVGKAVNRLEK